MMMDAETTTLLLLGSPSKGGRLLGQRIGSLMSNIRKRGGCGGKVDSFHHSSSSLHLDGDNSSSCDGLEEWEGHSSCINLGSSLTYQLMAQLEREHEENKRGESFESSASFLMRRALSNPAAQVDTVDAAVDLATSTSSASEVAEERLVENEQAQEDQAAKTIPQDQQEAFSEDDDRVKALQRLSFSSVPSLSSYRSSACSGRSSMRSSVRSSLRSSARRSTLRSTIEDLNEFLQDFVDEEDDEDAAAAAEDAAQRCSSFALDKQKESATSKKELTAEDYYPELSPSELHDSTVRFIVVDNCPSAVPTRTAPPPPPPPAPPTTTLSRQWSDESATTGAAVKSPKYPRRKLSLGSYSETLAAVAAMSATPKAAAAAAAAPVAAATVSTAPRVPERRPSFDGDSSLSCLLRLNQMPDLSSSSAAALAQGDDVKIHQAKPRKEQQRRSIDSIPMRPRRSYCEQEGVPPVIRKPQRRLSSSKQDELSLTELLCTKASQLARAAECSKVDMCDWSICSEATIWTLAAEHDDETTTTAAARTASSLLSKDSSSSCGVSFPAANKLLGGEGEEDDEEDGDTFCASLLED